ncbi:peptidoglycan-binding protein [Cellulosimicrobium cellulans]|uniref:peptidoglycan-binding domain-containing protein n=1 Tax=Cellulosimicrobium cellulans TaxID=1710 RepID=UPI001EDC114B|nr:peptidoglycan-binding domain-containing protein [Cellulosimicrobium cellulans]UKJ63561.1 peptidoglycan-binding protein [Cellulosimicrobium cellulans]
MRRRHGPTGSPEDGRVAPTTPVERRAATPWVTVAAGAGAVTLVVAVAGMVGAATGGGEAVVVGVSAGAGNAVEDGVPVVTPRPDAPRPEVTRIPPPDHTHDPADGADPASTPAPRPSAGGTDAPPPSAEPAPTTEPPAAPSGTAPEPAPTTPAPTTEPDEASVTWVQERLRVHGADVAVTGTLDEATRAALRAFQEANGLPGDGAGAVTAATAEALAAAPEGGGEESTDPGGTAPTEPAPPSSTDRPSGTVPGPTPSTADQVEATLAPVS